MIYYFVSDDREDWAGGTEYATLHEAFRARGEDEFIHEVELIYSGSSLVETAFGQSVLPAGGTLEDDGDS
jgi:hypothetical protein